LSNFIKISIFVLFINNMNQQNLPPFKPITSITSKLASYSYGIMTLFVLIVSFGLLFFILFLVDITEESLFILIFLNIPLILISVVYIKRTLSYTTITIDQKGIKYFNKFKGQIIEEIHWKNFESIDNFEGSVYFLNRRTDSNYFNYDVASQVVNNKGALRFYWFTKKNGTVLLHKETFQGKHIFNMFYSNRLELVRSLLLGLRHFRPDIRIHPHAYGLYFINPETFKIDYAKRDNAMVLAFLILLIVGLVLFFIIMSNLNHCC
jgi:hypothetical protein